METRPETTELKDVWGRLTVIVDDGLVIRESIKRSPLEPADPITKMKTDYLNFFEPELAAIQRIDEAERCGVAEQEWIELARNTGIRLLEIYGQAEERVQVS